MFLTPTVLIDNFVGSKKVLKISAVPCYKLTTFVLEKLWFILKYVYDSYDSR